MCGRFTLTAALKTIQGRFDFDDNIMEAAAGNYRPNRNVSPTQSVLTVINAEGRSRPALMRWGLVPSWSKQEKTDYALINARAETLAVKPMFRPLIARNRCLIIADGFYEFRAEGKKKIPVRFSMSDDSLFTFAGLYERWKDPMSGNMILSCTIITTEPNEIVKPIHNRMPVILRREDECRWLDSSANTVDMAALLVPFDHLRMRAEDTDPQITAYGKKKKKDDLQLF